MKRVLIVEDSQDKSRLLIQAIRDIPNGAHIDVVRVSNTIEATKRLEKDQFDVMILDLVIPRRDEDAPAPENAIALLTEIRGRIDLIKPLVIIGTTEHDVAFKEWHMTFERDLWYLLFTAPVDVTWVQQLSRRLTYLFDSVDEWRKVSMYESRADVCIITTVATETKHIHREFAPIKPLSIVDDCVTYYSSEVQRNVELKSPSLRVICVETGVKGMAAAASLATKCIYEFRPQWLVICGIAAGVSQKTNFGDLLLPNRIIDYVAGKVKMDKGGEETFLGDTSVLSIDERWSGKFASYSINGGLMSDLLQDWNGSKPNIPPKIVLGPMATGSAVVQSDNTVLNLLERFRDVVGIDMEAYGVFLAAKAVAGPRPDVFCFKAVSDFANTEKDDTWQEYASYLSARFTKRFLSDYFPAHKISLKVAGDS